MGFPLARARTRKRVAVVGAVALALTGVALTRTKGAEAHEVVTPYPLTCSMVGLNPTFTSTHVPEAGTTAGAPLTLQVKLATPATGMAMPTTSLSFTLPKPALISRITGVTFKTGGNFTGSASVNATTGAATLTFRGNAQSNAITLPDFDIAGVTSTAAMPGDRVSWIGPSQITLLNGTAAVDTCTPASGAAIQYAPTVVLDGGAGCTTTTADPGHGDHGDHGAPACTTTTVTTRPTTATTSTTRPTTQTTPTTRPTTQTTPSTRPTTQTTPTTRTTTRPTTPTTMNPGGGLGGLLKWILCLLFRICG
jgi:hypothetical protein